MPWCPKCGKKYPPPETDCEDCNAVLVPNPPHGKDLSDETNLVAICYLDNEFEGPLIQDFLLAAGIQSTIRPFHEAYDSIRLGADYNHWGDLLVFETDAEKASELLDEYTQELENKSSSPEQNG